MLDIPLFPNTCKKLEGCLVVGKKVWKRKLPCTRQRRNTIVSREHLIASVPAVRVRDLVRVDVPAVVVPVHVDRAKHTSVIVNKTICGTADLSII